MNQASKRVVEALPKLNEASKDIQAALQSETATGMGNISPDGNGTLQENGGYRVSKETAALLSCIEELSTLYGHIYDALSLTYDGVLQIDRGVVGKALFDALQVVDSELYSFLSQSIRENLSPSSGVRQI